MKSPKLVAVVSLLALSCASAAAFAQTSCMPLPPGSTTPPPIMLPPGMTWCAPASTATPFTATPGQGYEHASAKGKESIEENVAMSGTIDKTNNILDVTSISHGHIHIGLRLNGQGLPGNGIEITENLTGKGGVGTYKFKPL